MSKAGFIIFGGIISACSHFDMNPNAEVLCDIRLSQTVSFDDLSVRAYSDRHGSYLTLDACPDHTVSVDYSRSDLYSRGHEDLLRQMRLSAFQGVNPIKMRISGTYTGSDGKDIPAIVIVDRILGYE